VFCNAEYRGETEETVVSEERGWKIVVHSSQQREERTKKRLRSYRAFGLVASVAFGACGTRSAQTVLALFPPSPLRLRRPIKAELTSPFSGFIQLSFFNPSVLRTPPLYLALPNTGEEGEIQYFCSTVVSTPPSLRATSPIFSVAKHRGGVWDSVFLLYCRFNPLVLRTLPLYLYVTPRNATGHGRGRGLKEAFQFWYKDRFYTSPLCFVTQNIGERPKKHLFLRRGVERLLFILLSSEKNEPRSAAAVIGLFGSSSRSSSGAVELASLKQSSPFFLRLPCVFAAR